MGNPGLLGNLGFGARESIVGSDLLLAITCPFQILDLCKTRGDSSRGAAWRFPTTARTAIKGSGGKATFVKCDVLKAADVEALVKAAVDAYGRLDCAHSNAGLEGPVAPTADYAGADWDRVIGINLKGCLVLYGV